MTEHFREVFIRNWVLKAFIGIHPHEYRRRQAIRLNIVLLQDDVVPFRSEKIAHVINYETHRLAIKNIIEETHTPLLETLADRIAEACLRDPLVKEVRVTCEKLGLFKDTESCGVSLVRRQGDYSYSSGPPF